MYNLSIPSQIIILYSKCCFVASFSPNIGTSPNELIYVYILIFNSNVLYGFVLTFLN